mgnify:CR=1 FL=1
MKRASAGGQAMMRLGRRASLRVAFYLLTFAATAYAECAWGCMQARPAPVVDLDNDKSGVFRVQRE